MNRPAFLHNGVHVTDTCIVYYHGNDWAGIPSRQRYIMSAMSKYVPIIYLDQSRGPRGRVVYEHPMPDVTVVRGLVKMIYALRMRGLEFAIPLYVRWQCRKLRRRYKTIILWTAENWLRPHHFLPHDLLVYDCMDPCFSDDPVVRTAYEARERDVVEAADIVFASAEALAEECRRWRGDVTLLNNACEPSDYTPELLAAAKRPSWWPTRDGPVVAYLGAIDWRFDFEFAEAACRMNPDVQFVIAGGVVPPFETQMARLRRLKNVVCPGSISVDQGSRYILSNCDVGLILFKRNHFNDALNPVKLYAHAYLGKPMVGTAVRELVLRPEIVRVASTPEAFGKAVADALRESGKDSVVERQKAFGRRNTWADRAEVAWKIISSCIDRRATA